MNFLITGIASIIAGFVALLGRKGVVVTASIATLVALTVAFTLVINGMLNLILATLVMPSWMQSIMWFVPSNFAVIFGVLLAANIARAGYDLAIEKLHLATSAS